MKRILVMLSFLAAIPCSAWAQGNLVSPLPFLGSRTNIDRWQQEHAVAFDLRIDKTNGMTQRISYPYSPSQGDLHPVIEGRLPSQLDAFVSSNEVGMPITVWVGLEWQILRTNGVISTRGIECAKPTFNLQFNTQGHAIVPPDTFSSWPLNWYIVVTNRPPGVERVEYLSIDGYGNPYPGVITTNGSGTLFSGERDAWILDLFYIDPLRSSQWTNVSDFIIFHYNINAGWHDTFSVQTGYQTDSTIVWLSSFRMNGAVTTAIKGWPGRQVVIETSQNLTTWTSNSPPVTLDQNGRGNFEGPAALQRFVRGRLVSP